MWSVPNRETEEGELYEAQIRRALQACPNAFDGGHSSCHCANCIPQTHQSPQPPRHYLSTAAAMGLWHFSLGCPPMST